MPDLLSLKPLPGWSRPYGSHLPEITVCVIKFASPCLNGIMTLHQTNGSETVLIGEANTFSTLTFSTHVSV